MILRISVLTLMVSVGLACGAVGDNCPQVGNLGYNAYEGALTGGTGLEKRFGPGVGYPTNNADFFHRYLPPEDWGKYGYGTGHLGEGWGPYVFSRGHGSSPPGLFDPLPGTFEGAPPPSINVKRGRIRVAVRDDLPGVECVTITILAFNGAELATQSKTCPPFKFNFPVLDGCKNVRVRIDYVNRGLSATSYPL